MFDLSALLLLLALLIKDFQYVIISHLAKMLRQVTLDSTSIWNALILVAHGVIALNSRFKGIISMKGGLIDISA